MENFQCLPVVVSVTGTLKTAKSAKFRYKLLCLAEVLLLKPIAGEVLEGVEEHLQQTKHVNKISQARK
jgi:hypothetical protein